MTGTALAVLLAAAPAGAVELVPGSSIDRIYVVTFAHADVGFNAPPSVMDQRNHDRTVTALDLADAHPGFRWTVETAHQLDGFLERASAADLARFEAALATGQLGVGAGFANLHTGVCGEEELNQLPVRAVERLAPYGYSPRVALLSDVPGRSLAIPRVYASAGVHYGILSANNSLGGRPDIPLAERPFWWTSPDGSRMLTWVTYADEAYMEGWYTWGLGSVLDAASRLPSIIRDFETNGYPYHALMVPYASDDNEPFQTLHEVIADWNSIYTQPELVLVQPEEFFEDMLAAYGEEGFVTHEGDSAGYWEDVATTSPASSKAVRRARARLPDVEALWSARWLEGDDYPHTEVDRAWRDAMLLDEHSNAGAGWPGLLTEAEINQENLEFLAMAMACADTTAELEQRALDALAPPLVPADGRALVVFNPLGDSFDGVVEATTATALHPSTRLIDATTGADVPFRWTHRDRTALAFETSVPARGWARLDIAAGDPVPMPARTPATEVSTGDLHLVLRADGTADSLAEVSSGAEWLAPDAAHDFAGLEAATHALEFLGLYEKMPYEDVQIFVEADAPLFRRALVVAGDQRVAEYRLYADERRLDVLLWLDRATLPAVPYDLHSLHVGTAFPTALALPTTLWVDGPEGWYRPGPDSLPGAAVRHFGVATGARLEGSDGRWVTVTSRDTAVLNLGEMEGYAQPDVETDENALNFKLIRHHAEALTSDHGVVSIDAEPGSNSIVEYRFDLRFGEPGDPAPTREQLRRDLAPPLVAHVTAGTGGKPGPAGTFFEVEGEVSVVAMRQARTDDSALVLRLRAGEVGGTAVIRHPYRPATAWTTDLVERAIAELTVVDDSVEVDVPAHGVVTVLLDDFLGPAPPPPDDTGHGDTATPIDDTGAPADDPDSATEAADSALPPGETGSPTDPSTAAAAGCGCATGTGTGTGAATLILLAVAASRRHTTAHRLP